MENKRSALPDDDADDKLFTWEMKEQFFMLVSCSRSHPGLLVVVHV
jgi:hypothetical protein